MNLIITPSSDPLDDLLAVEGSLMGRDIINRVPALSEALGSIELALTGERGRTAVMMAKIAIDGAPADAADDNEHFEAARNVVTLAIREITEAR